MPSATLELLSLGDQILQPWSSLIPHQPTSKQLGFLWLDCLEALYGGAAGGGKSDALLMAALQYDSLPGYAALILRRTFADLSKPGALIPRAHEWLQPTRAHWSERDKTWTFPSGATLTFGYLEHENDVYQYQSTEFQSISFDELTQFSESQYRYMFSRLRRRAGVDVPLRMRAASNPGGIGHDWVKQRFLVEGPSTGRVFLPATLDDNPHLDRQEYVRSMAELDPITRAQLLKGDWTARVGGSKFKREWFKVQDAAPESMRRVRYWDLASTQPKPGADPDYTVGALMGTRGDGIFYVLDIRRMRGSPREVEALIAQTAKLDGPAVTVRMEQEPGASGVAMIDHYGRNVLAGYSFLGVKVTGEKEIRANPLSSAAEAGNIILKTGSWIGAFLDEAEAFPLGSHDDQVDAASGAHSELALGRQAKVYL